MKIRNGFVSNSSSASFIIKMKTNFSDEVIEKYIRESDEYFDKYWDGGKVRKFDLSGGFSVKSPKYEIVERDPIKNEVYKRIDERTVEISITTSMFNDWTDAPAWKFIRAVSENKLNGIEVHEIIQTEREYIDCHEKVEFDSRVWGYEYTDRETDKLDYLKRQKSAEIHYQNYLISIGYIPTQEEIVEFTKNQLNQ